jgi:hypothetical protein
MKTLTEVVETLSDQLDKLQNNDIDAAAANAVCARANRIILSARLQLKCCKLSPELDRFLAEGRGGDLDERERHES